MEEFFWDINVRSNYIIIDFKFGEKEEKSQVDNKNVFQKSKFCLNNKFIKMRIF